MPDPDLSEFGFVPDPEDFGFVAEDEAPPPAPVDAPTIRDSSRDYSAPAAAGETEYRLRSGERVGRSIQLEPTEIEGTVPREAASPVLGATGGGGEVSLPSWLRDAARGAAGAATGPLGVLATTRMSRQSTDDSPVTMTPEGVVSGATRAWLSAPTGLNPSIGIGGVSRLGALLGSDAAAGAADRMRATEAADPTGAAVGETAVMLPAMAVPGVAERTAATRGWGALRSMLGQAAESGYLGAQSADDVSTARGLDRAQDVALSGLAGGALGGVGSRMVRAAGGSPTAAAALQDTADALRVRQALGHRDIGRMRRVARAGGGGLDGVGQVADELRAEGVFGRHGLATDDEIQAAMQGMLERGRQSGREVFETMAERESMGGLRDAAGGSVDLGPLVQGMREEIARLDSIPGAGPQRAALQSWLDEVERTAPGGRVPFQRAQEIKAFLDSQTNWNGGGLEPIQGQLPTLRREFQRAMQAAATGEGIGDQYARSRRQQQLGHLFTDAQEDSALKQATNSQVGLIPSVLGGGLGGAIGQLTGADPIAGTLLGVMGARALQRYEHGAAAGARELAARILRSERLTPEVRAIVERAMARGPESLPAVLFVLQQQLPWVRASAQDEEATETTNNAAQEQQETDR